MPAPSFADTARGGGVRTLAIEVRGYGELHSPKRC